MATNINGDTGVDKIQAGVVEAGDLADASVTDAKIDTMSSSKLTGALPAIDGSALTGLGGGGFSNMDVFTSSGTWTNPGSVTKVKVTVIGGGGGAVASPSAPTFYNPWNATAGGTSSFGAYCSATGGAKGDATFDVGELANAGNPGTGSGGAINGGGVSHASINSGNLSKSGTASSISFNGLASTSTSTSFPGLGYGSPSPGSEGTGGCILSGGPSPAGTYNAAAAGGAGGGAIKVTAIPTSPVPVTIGAGGVASGVPAPNLANNTASGGSGIVIVEY